MKDMSACNVILKSILLFDFIFSLWGIFFNQIFY